MIRPLCGDSARTTRKPTATLRKRGSRPTTIPYAHPPAEDGAFTGVLTVVSDTSDQRRAEGERLLSNAVEQTADGVFITDSAG